MNHEPVLKKIYAIVTEASYNITTGETVVKLLTDTGEIDVINEAPGLLKASFDRDRQISQDLLTQYIDHITRGIYDLHFCE